MLPPLTVICRKPPTSMANCELTCIAREPIDMAQIETQHGSYVNIFARRRDEAGHRIRIVELPALNALPDSMFVEDVAILLDDCAVITRPGAASRRPEVDGIVESVAALRGEFCRIKEPGTVEGGDVLCVGRFVVIGKSTRSNDAGFEQLRAYLEPRNYTVLQCPIQGCLHLKSAVSKVCEGTVLVNPQWVAPEFFEGLGLRVVLVDPTEPDSANVLTFVSGTADGAVRERTIVVAAAFPKLAEKLVQFVAEERIAEREGLTRVVVEVIDVKEIAKAEGALTCCSLLSYGSEW